MGIMDKSFKIDFLIIGGTKCGSTSLADYVTISEKVNFCKLKEPALLNKSYFLNELSYYKSLFDHNHLGMKGEATTGYSRISHVDTVIDNLKKIDSKPKIILSVRNQVKRIESTYIQDLKSGKINPKDKDVISKMLNDSNTIERGMFGEVIQKYIDYVGEDSVLVLPFDSVVKENTPELLKLKNFLGLEDSLPLTLPKSNNSNESYRANFVSRIYKSKIAPSFKYKNQGALRWIADLNKKYFRKKIKIENKIKLNDKQIDMLKKTYMKDEELFVKLVKWSYWDLKK